MWGYTKYNEALKSLSQVVSEDEYDEQYLYDLEWLYGEVHRSLAEKGGIDLEYLYASVKVTLFDYREYCGCWTEAYRPKSIESV